MNSIDHNSLNDESEMENDDDDDEEVECSFEGRKRRKQEDYLLINKKKKNEKISTKNKIAKVVDKEFYKNNNKPPTVEELNRLHENENLFNSNLFRLQIEELLNEIKIKQKYITAFEKWYESFKNFVLNLENYEFKKFNKKINIVKLEEIKKNVCYLCRTDNDDDNGGSSSSSPTASSFIKPHKVDVFGRYKINAIIGSNLEVDIKVVIPKSYFREKDYLNNRYSAKHNFYASFFTTELTKTKLARKICYSFENCYVSLPTLIITPAAADCQKTIVTIHFVPQTGSLKHYRFEPRKNNFKVSIFEDLLKISEKEKIIGIGNVQTPFYNSAIARNALLETNYGHLENALKDLKNIQDGIKLLFVWLKQRFMMMSCFSFNNKGSGGGEDLILFVIFYLISKKRLNKHMSSYQVVRNFWHFMSSSDWTEKPISLCENVKEDIIQQFKENFDVVFLDITGSYNLTAFLDVNVYYKIQRESKFAFKLLTNNDKSIQFNNSFATLFMTNMPLQEQYDALIIIKSENEFKDILKKNVSVEERIRYLGYQDILIQKYMASVLKKGLNNRIKTLVPLLQEEDNFTKEIGCNFLNQSKKKEKVQQYSFKKNKLIFGLTLDPENAYKLIEMGPPADDREKAMEFQKFWGEMAQIRRFNDGRINETVYFNESAEENCIHEKRKIFKKIIDFIMLKKLNLNDYYIFGDQLEKFILPIEEPTLNVITCYDRLTKLLRSLNLPLTITTVHGKSDVFCFSDLFPPLPVAYDADNKFTKLINDKIVFREDEDTTIISDDDDIEKKWVPKYCAPIECVIHLNMMNSKWPNNLEALKNIKRAFYLKIAQILRQKHKIKCNVCNFDRFDQDYFDVYFEGYLFRFTLYHSKEIGFLKKKEINSTTTGLISYNNKETNDNSIEYEKELDIKCKIIGALNGINSQFSSFGPSNTLIKRWLRSQLIDNFYMPDLVINLLNASLYLNKTYMDNSNLIQLQFLRFLKFIRDHDWNLNGVVVNFNDEISKEQLDMFENNFQQNRQSYPPLYIITPYDNGKSLFTLNTACSSNKEVLRRMSILAASTYKILTENSLDKVKPDILKKIFIPNLDGYDLLIHLEPSLNSKKKMEEEIKSHQRKGVGNNYFVDKELMKDSPIPVIGFNPVDLYLKELRENYGEFAYFFHNCYGGCTIAVLWKQPNLFQEKEFKNVSVINGHLLKKKNDDEKRSLLVFNQEVIIEDFYNLGKTLVRSIVVKK